jgi:hypothetical protein
MNKILSPVALEDGSPTFGHRLDGTGFRASFNEDDILPVIRWRLAWHAPLSYITQEPNKYALLALLQVDEYTNVDTSEQSTQQPPTLDKYLFQSIFTLLASVKGFQLYTMFAAASRFQAFSIF